MGKKDRILEYREASSLLTASCHRPLRFCDSIVKINTYKDSSCSVIKFLTIENIFAFVDEWPLPEKDEMMACQLISSALKVFKGKLLTYSLLFS